MGTCAGCVAHTQRPDTRVLKSRARAGDTWAARELALMYRFGYYQRIPSRKGVRRRRKGLDDEISSAFCCILEV
eukprot:1090269-Amorphochlora_amoeboformis.AAC.2